MKVQDFIDKNAKFRVMFEDRAVLSDDLILMSAEQVHNLGEIEVDLDLNNIDKTSDYATLKPVQKDDLFIEFKDLTDKEIEILDAIVDRAYSSDLGYRLEERDIQPSTIEMDIHCAYSNGDLDMQTLLDFDDFNFSHDIIGVYNTLDRTTGKLEGGFLPRSYRPNKSASLEDKIKDADSKVAENEASRAETAVIDKNKVVDR